MFDSVGSPPSTAVSSTLDLSGISVRAPISIINSIEDGPVRQELRIGNRQDRISEDAMMIGGALISITASYLLVLILWSFGF